MKVNESNYDILKRVEDITNTDYEIKWFDAENIDGYIESDSLISMIEDLIGKVENLEEEIEDIKSDRDSNYRPVSVAEQIDYNESW